MNKKTKKQKSRKPNDKLENKKEKLTFIPSKKKEKTKKLNPQKADRVRVPGGGIILACRLPAPQVHLRDH